MGNLCCAKDFYSAGAVFGRNQLSGEFVLVLLGMAGDNEWSELLSQSVGRRNIIRVGHSSYRLVP